MDNQANGELAPQTLLEWRKAKGLLQEEAGELIGVSKVSWGNWEMYRKPPRPTHLEKLSRMTGLTYEQILRPDRAGSPQGDHAGATLTEEDAAQPSSVPFRKAG